MPKLVRRVTPRSFATEQDFRAWARREVLGKATQLARLSAEDHDLARAIEPYQPELARRLHAVAEERDAMFEMVRSLLTSN